MIPYTERDTDLNLRPPYAMDGVRACVAIRGIRWEVAQDWVDRTLNWRPPGTGANPHYLALPLGFVTFMRVAAMRSLDPAHSHWGAISESEMHVTLMLMERGTLGKISFYPVVLCLDSSPALIAGREVFGFPKILGGVDMGPDRCEARAEIYGSMGDHTTQAGSTLVRIRRTDGVAPAQAPGLIGGGNRNFGGCLADMAAEELTGGFPLNAGDSELWNRSSGGLKMNNVLADIPDMLSQLPMSADFVFLKQFRDAAAANRACYRAIVRTKVRFRDVTAVSRAQGSWDIEVPEYHSSSLLTRLAMVSGEIAAPTRAEFAFDLPLGSTLWSAVS